jgi:hypothetical protein
LIVVAAVAVAWAGLFVHNRVEFPKLSFASPEYAVPTLVWLALLLAWSLLPNTGWTATLLLGWGALSLAGAVITVLPLPFLPFQPEQSLRHYAVHVVYAATQLPIIGLMYGNRVNPEAKP